jgi:hypothetical protein
MLALALGMVTLAPLQATAAPVLPVLPGSTSGNHLIQSKSIDLEADRGCGHFTGELQYWKFVQSGRATDYYFEVVGTLYSNCSGATVHLRSYWTPDTIGNEQTVIIGSLTGVSQEAIDWASGLYQIGIKNMHVLLCVLNVAGAGCNPSPSLPGS